MSKTEDFYKNKNKQVKSYSAEWYRMKAGRAWVKNLNVLAEFLEAKAREISIAHPETIRRMEMITSHTPARAGDSAANSYRVVGTPWRTRFII